MNLKQSRREFLKLMPLFYLSGLNSHLFPPTSLPLSVDKRQNIIVLVFDTLSALHLQIHGYQRETMPNLARFAENATIYHSHYSAGNFTMPGTASILTGTYPWSHRGFHFFGSVKREFSTKNMFHTFRDNQYTCFTFSHNMLANMLLSQFQKGIDTLAMPRDVPLYDPNISDVLFPRDYATAFRSEYAYLNDSKKPASSLLFDLLALILQKENSRRINERLEDLFPRGLPQTSGILCLLEDTFDWLLLQLKELQNPYLAYIHLMPAHHPYHTRAEFIDIFKDGWKPVPKPEHIYSNIAYEDMNSFREMMDEQRRHYDEFIAYADAEFGRFYKLLSQEGFLKNTMVVITSDHGEMFERGVWAHKTKTLYEPIIRVPLLISEPDQNIRHDVFTSTSSVDLFPTLLHLSGMECPNWIEGNILPPYATNTSENSRELFAVEAKSNSRTGPLNMATVAIIKDNFKLIKYWGYPDNNDFFELFDVKNDPDELHDLKNERKSIATDLLEELQVKIDEYNGERW